MPPGRFDIFGGTRRAVEAANAEMGAAEYGQRDVLVSLLAEVARNYIGARSYQQRLAITRDNIRVQREILDLTSNRYENGLSSDLDVQQATALLTDTEAQVPSLETGFDESVRHLAVLLGQPPGALLDDMSVETTHSTNAAGRAGGIAVRFAATPSGRATRGTRTGCRHGAHRRGQGGFVPEIFADGHCRSAKAYPRTTGLITRAGIGPPGRPCNGNCFRPAASGPMSGSRTPARNRRWMPTSKRC